MKAPALTDRRPPAVTERDAVLRQFDLAARLALLGAGLAAQAAMWTVGHSRVYLVAALLLVAVSIESSRRPLRTYLPTAKGRRRKFSQRQLIAVRVVAGVLVAEACLGVVGWLQFADMQSMATPLGLLLVSVQVAHAMAVESRRDLKLGCAVVVALLVHAGAFTTTAAVKLPMLGALVFLLAAAALLQRASALAQVDAIALPGRAPVARALAAPVTTAVVVGVAVFLALPNSLNLGVKVVGRHGADQAGSQNGAPVDTTSPTVGARAIADAGAATLDLRTRGDLPATPELIVDAAAPAYWQGSVFDHFDGTTWTATASPASTASSAAAGARWPVDSSGVQTAPPDLTATAATGVRRTDLVDVVAPSPLDVVLAPGHPIAYRGAGQVTGDEHAAQLTGGPTDGAAYQVTSTHIDATAAQLRAAKGADAGDQRWHELPPDLPPRVPNLAADLAGHSASRYDAVTTIEEYLRTHETYDLKSAVPAVGDDAVDDFLFVTNRGFCEQFATAAVVMLRSIGIPARLVVGFAGGDTTSQPGHRILRGADAHAWVQVWYQGIGWVDSDPTASAVLPSNETQPVKAAGVTPATATTAPTGATTAPTGGATAQPSPTAQPTPSSSATPKPTKTVVPGGRAVWLEVIGALAILCVLFTRLGSQLLRRRRGRPTRSWRPTDGPVLQAYLRLDTSLAGARRAPQESLRDVGRRLADAGAFVDRHGRRAASVDEIATTLHCLEQECYGIEPPVHADVVAAVDVLDRLRRAAGSLPVTPDLVTSSVNSTR